MNMLYKKKIIRFVVCIVIITNMICPNVLAKSSPDFIEYITNKVYDDCKGESYEGQQMTRDFIRQKIVEVDNQLPVSLSLYNIDTYPIILQCDKYGENYSLRVNFESYYWRGIKLGDSATYTIIQQSIQQIENKGGGNFNLLNTGNINLLTITLSVSISIFLSLLSGWYFIYRKSTKK